MSSVAPSASSKPAAATGTRATPAAPSPAPAPHEYRTRLLFGIRRRILGAFALVILGGLGAYQVAHLGHARITVAIERASAAQDLDSVATLMLARREMVTRTNLIVICAVAFAVVVGLFLERSLTGPLRQLEDATRRLGTGDLSTRVALGGSDEIARLGRCFDEMAAELAARQARLVETEKLAGIGRLAAGVAHEINNPLAVIRGYSALLAKSADERTAGDARLVLEEALRCQAIVAGLLDLARPKDVVRRPCDVVELCREVADRVRQTSPGIEIEVRAPAAVSAELDEDKLRQVLLNLFRNAAEAAPPSGAEDPAVTAAARPGVEIDVVRQARTLVVRIRDHGPGLSDEVRARLFEPFFTTKGAQGVGLGLAVSAAIAHAHGGTITAENAPDQGACFELRLPLGGEEGRA